MAPTISVIMAVYNSENYLSKAINSILSQTYKDFELIIVDDASIDNSSRIINRFEKVDSRIIVIHNKKNLGIGKSRNIGMDKASGEYIAVMDSDDVSLDNRLQKQITYMKQNPDSLVLGGQLMLIDCNDDVIQATTDYPIKIYRWDTLTSTRVIAHPCMMIRRDYLQRLGGYPENYVNCVDRGLFQKMSLDKDFNMQNLEDLILKYRVHQASTSLKNGNIQKRNSFIFRKETIEALLGQSISDDEFSMIFDKEIQSASVSLTRNSFNLFEAFLKKYKKTYKPIYPEWRYAKNDFAKRSFLLLKRYPVENFRYLCRLLYYDPLIFSKRLRLKFCKD